MLGLFVVLKDRIEERLGRRSDRVGGIIVLHPIGIRQAAVATADVFLAWTIGNG